LADQENWDPFFGKVRAQRDGFFPFYEGWTKANIARAAIGGLCLFIWLLSGVAEKAGFLYPVWLQALLIAAGFGLVFWAAVRAPRDSEVNGAAKVFDPWRQSLAELAEKRGWSLRLIRPAEPAPMRKAKGKARPDPVLARTKIVQAMARVRTDIALPEQQIMDLLDTGFRTDHGHCTYYVADPEMHSLTQTAPAMVLPSATVGAPLDPQAVLWFSRESMPIWAAMCMSQTGSAHNRPAGQHITIAKGVTLHAIFGFPLERDAGVDADVMGKIPVVMSRLKQMDSSEFNSIFAVKLKRGTELNLFQALTPAAQIHMIDAYRKDGAELCIRGPNAFVRFTRSIDYREQDNAHLRATRLSDFIDESLGHIPKLKTFME
jgi:hypothetical protein